MDSGSRSLWRASRRARGSEDHHGHKALADGAGGLAAAVGAAGLYWSIQVGHVLDPTAMAFLVAGVVMLAIGFVATLSTSRDCGPTRWTRSYKHADAISSC